MDARSARLINSVVGSATVDEREGHAEVHYDTASLDQLVTAVRESRDPDAFVCYAMALARVCVTNVGELRSVADRQVPATVRGERCWVAAIAAVELEALLHRLSRRRLVEGRDGLFHTIDQGPVIAPGASCTHDECPHERVRQEFIERLGGEAV